MMAQLDAVFMTVRASEMARVKELVPELALPCTKATKRQPQAVVGFLADRSSRRLGAAPVT